MARIQSLIAAGDIYQANLTFQCDVAVAGDPLAAYARLRGQKAGWGGVVFTGGHWLLSASPELFFAMAGGVATARPMKGTARRDPDPAADRRAAETLVTDPKQRAENLMIVDLLRNDLAHVGGAGRRLRAGALRAGDLSNRPSHDVHRHGAAGGRADAVDVLAHLFPCGSITGAPKIRAMEIIADVEKGRRGPYTGAIGRIDAPGGAAFSVAIRTLVLAEGTACASLGLGSAIVADSVAADEWAECAAKGNSWTSARPASI